MTTLYEISKDILAIMQEIEEDYDPLATDQMDITSRFDSLQIKFNDKIENICKYIRDLETDDLKIRAEAVRLAMLADSKKKTAERLKNYVSSILQVQWIDKLELDIFKLSFRPSQVLEIIDEALVPDTFKEKIVTESIKIDKNKIKEYIKSSNDLPVPWVQLINKKNLQIK